MISRSNPSAAYRLRFDINQGFGKLDMTSYLSERHTLDFGGGAIHYALLPGEYLPEGVESLVMADRIPKETALEASLYLADRWDLTPELSVNAGLRYTMFRTPDTTYHAPDLRLSMRYAFGSDLSFKAGINTLQQNIHKLSNTTIMSPTDTWKLSDANIRPQKGIQVAAGLYRNFLSNTLETSIEGYYKRFRAQPVPDSRLFPHGFLRQY
jgi:outer membrane receptor protein involved in Fe transport